MTVFKAALLSTVAVLGLSAATDYMPLNSGNEWTYRENLSGQTFTIRVGLGLMQNGNVYYKVTGYASGPMYLRNAEDGNLYFLDQDNEREFLFKSFEPMSGGWYDTLIGGCAQGYQPQQKMVEYSGAHSYFSNALQVLYRNYSCVDAGVERELYVANVGLVQRTVTTISGPRTWDLVHARVGPVVFTGEPNTSFRISLDRTRVEPSPGEAQTLRVAMRLSVYHSPGLTLRVSPQRYDIQVRNSTGDVVWRWSDSVAYPQVIEDRHISGEVELVQAIPLELRGGAPLPPGQYTVEAWLHTVERQFAAATKFEVVPQG